MALLPWPPGGQEVVTTPTPLRPPGGHAWRRPSVSLCPRGGGRAAASALSPGRVCPPQAQRWRSENFERPVDLEGSGDDDSFPDDELDDLYSGSGSGCKYRPFPSCVRVGLATSVCLLSPRKAGPRPQGPAGSLRRWGAGGSGGQAGVPRGPHAPGGPVVLGMEPGPYGLHAQDPQLPRLCSVSSPPGGDRHPPGARCSVLLQHSGELGGASPRPPGKGQRE